MSDIVDRLRNESALTLSSLCADALDEIKRLRAAVDTYLDAEEAFTRYTVLGTHKRNPDTAEDLAADVDAAYHALRQAVGR